MTGRESKRERTPKGAGDQRKAAPLSAARLPVRPPGLASGKAPCACGGRCPRCANQANTRRTPEVGVGQVQRRARLEAEADSVARAIVTQREGERPRRVEVRERTDLRAPSFSPAPGSRSSAHGSAADGSVELADPTRGAGSHRGLAREERQFFEPRFGRDFAGVRVFDGPAADARTKALGAEAFTHGQHIVLSRGAYRFDSVAGRELLAHELTHVVQQTHARPALQARLVVSGTRPSDRRDPLGALPSDAAYQAAVFPDMDAQLHQLCDGFRVNSSTGVVEQRPPGFCTDRALVSAGATPVGCCCLCELDASPNTWTIQVTRLGGPSTDESTRTVLLHPTNSDFRFDVFNVGNTLSPDSMVQVAGHELCGHAALMELGAHTGDHDRTTTDVHDSTVNVENEISLEQGAPLAAQRGLAASGSHRGESVAIVTVRFYPHDRVSASSLPSAEKVKLRLAARFAHPSAGDTWVDILGHSDASGSAAVKLRVSQERADSVRSFLISQGVTSRIRKSFTDGVTGVSHTVTGDRYTRVEGRGDADLLPGVSPTAGEQRRVDILMTGRPAGAQNPIAATPTAVTPVGPSSPGTVSTLQASGNPCQQLLVNTAWP